MTPRILVVDIETAPGRAYIWSLFDNGPIPLERLIEPGRILCWGAKWVGNPTICQMDERDGRKDMLSGLRLMLIEADAVVSYNGVRFDFPRVNGELLAEGLEPVPPLTHIDLYQTTRKMGYMSNKLQFVAMVLKIGQKLKHAGFGLWKSIVETGNADSWDKMLRYNAQDVRLTDRAYKKMRAHIPNHPRLFPNRNHNETCHKCGSTRLQSRGHRYTRMFKIERFQCLGCGSWPEGKRSKIR